MTINEFTEALVSLEKAKSESVVIVSVHDKTGKYLFDADITSVEEDRFSGKIIVINAQEEA